MTHKELLSFYRNDKEVIDELFNKIYFSVYTPTLSHHDDFAEALNIEREAAKVLFYTVMYSMNCKDDTPWIIKHFLRECKYSFTFSNLLIKKGILSKINREILEDLARDATDKAEEKCRNGKKKLQELRAGQGNAVVPDTQA